MKSKQNYVLVAIAMIALGAATILLTMPAVAFADGGSGIRTMMALGIHTTFDLDQTATRTTASIVQVKELIRTTIIQTIN